MQIKPYHLCETDKDFDNLLLAVETELYAEVLEKYEMEMVELEQQLIKEVCTNHEEKYAYATTVKKN